LKLGAAPGKRSDNVLGRCVEMQAQGIDGFSDEQIRNALVAFIYGGPPQVAMAVPQALEQLLRRPDALAGAQQAARDGDDKLLAGYFFEAMRFDPIGPFVPRVASKDASIATGTSRAAQVPKDANVYVAFSSAMMDQRKIPDPRAFDPRRPPDDYIHFGYGLHQCFGIHLNKALLPLILKPLLQRKNLRRAPGPKGKLIKRGGVFADTLFVNYDGGNQSLCRPAALDDLGRALGEQLEADRAAELAGTVGRSGARGLDDAVASVIQHRRGERHLIALHFGKSRDRRIAMAVEHPQHLAFGVGAGVRSGIVDRSEDAACFKVTRGAFDGDDALPRRRQHFLRGKFVGDATGETDALKPRARHDQSVRGSHRAAIR
jgi:hypothetical protein